MRRRDRSSVTSSTCPRPSPFPTARSSSSSTDERTCPSSSLRVCSKNRSSSHGGAAGRCASQPTQAATLLAELASVEIQASVRIDTNIAALRAETTATNGDVAIVEGYYSAGDGGGGDFYWDAGSSELENGGTIIEVNTHPATGRWKRRFSGPIHAKWFGVKADCVRVYDGSVSPNSNVLTSVTAGFTSAA